MEGKFLEHALHHGIQAAGTDVFHRAVHLGGDVCQGGDAVGGEGNRHIFGPHQRGVLPGQGIVGFGQDADEIAFGQRLQFHPDRQAALQFGQQVRGFGDVERARGDEEDVVGLDRAVLGADGGAFDQRQQVALDAFAGDIGPARVAAGADLVDLVQKDDAVFLNRLECGGADGLVIQKLVGLLPDQDVIALGHGQAFVRGAATEGLEDVLQPLHLLFHPRHAKAHWQGRGVGDIKVDQRVIQLAAFQLGAEHLARLVAGVLAGDGLDHPVLGGLLRAGLHVLAHLGAGVGHCHIHQIADDAVHVAADIANLGELGRFDLQERGFRQLCKAAADLGLADAGGADHQDVLGIDLIPQVVAKALPAPAVAQSHGDGAFCVGLADDEAVKLGDDFARGQVGHSVLA